MIVCHCRSSNGWPIKWKLIYKFNQGWKRSSRWYTYSLLKQLKSVMLNVDNYENGKKSIGPMNQKTVLHVQHTFLNRSTYTFYEHFMLKNVVWIPVRFFHNFLSLIYTLVAASISRFFTASMKFSCFPCKRKIGLLCFLSLALALSLFSKLT